jgi:diguanylate cyclase (GGDEF)-like protein
MDEPEHIRVGELDSRADDPPRADLLDEIFDRIAIGLTVQDETGRLILVNRAAAADPAASAAVRPPTTGDPAHPVVRLTASASSTAVDRNGRTFLTSRQRIDAFDRTLFVSSSVDVSDLTLAEGDLERRAHVDELTGLPNRETLKKRVEEAVGRGADGSRFALAFLDLDNFKHVNDYYSQAVGDALLVKIARRISGRIGASDLLARIGGDEFVLLIDPVDGDEQLRAMIDGISEAVRQPFYVEAFEVFTSASIGVSVFPEHGRSYELLRRNADAAMYGARTTAKGGAAIFDGAMGRAVTTRMELEQRLRLAIRDRMFSCAFQPKVDVRTEEVVGLEALVRWCDDRGTINPPGEFIGLAIELGLIDPITHFMLEEALQAVDQINDAFGPDTTISINVAARQAGDLRFMRSCVQTLRDSGCAHRFMIEVTEDAFVAKSQFQTEVLPLLRDIGVKVSIDDFGTGYSSLSALADITVDEVKVDRSFITAIHQRPRSQSVLKAIESLGLALGMNVVAEGVETFEELAYLQAATRIRVAQGFYFAKPFLIDEIATSRRLAGGGRSRSIAREHQEGRVRSAARPAGTRGRGS